VTPRSASSSATTPPSISSTSSGARRTRPPTCSPSRCSKTTRTHRARVAAELGVPLDALTWTLAEEIEFLFIHGLLHLIGHDHLEPEEEAEMKAEEVRLWRASRPAAKA
jgi:hypothetical protein